MSTKLVITICEMIILTHKKNQIFISSIGGRYSTLKIPHFKGMDNLMIRLIPLFPYCALGTILSKDDPECQYPVVDTHCVCQCPLPKL